MFCLSQADDNDNPNDLSDLSFIDRTYVGGEFGFTASGGYTFLNLSPIAGYRLTRPFSVGVGLKYQWTSYNDGFQRYSDHIYGGSIFTKYLISDFLVAHAEYEVINGPNYSVFIPGDRAWANMFFVGGGYVQGDEMFSYQILALYDLIDDRNSPYQYQYWLPGVPLIIRFSILIGL